MSQDRLQPIRERFSQVFVGFKGKFTDWMIYEALEGAILAIFDFFTPEQIYQAIQEDISIWDTPWYDFNEFRYQLQLIGHDPRILKHQEAFTAENIILWLGAKEGRPILASLMVNTPGGFNWLEKQVKEIKAALTSPIEVQTHGEPKPEEN